MSFRFKLNGILHTMDFVPSSVAKDKERAVPMYERVRNRRLLNEEIVFLPDRRTMLSN